MCVYQFFPVMSKPMSVISRGTKKKKKKTQENKKWQQQKHNIGCHCLTIHSIKENNYKLP